mgnify:FL=1
MRLAGKDEDPAYLSSLPVLGKQGYVELGQLARVERSQTEATRLVSSDGQPTILVAVLKKAGSNTLELIQRVQDYIEQRNQLTQATGVEK